jgi:undecaprenyl-diphosphatase
MSILEAAAFGLLQGLTEFLPVSSSGHLAVLKEIWGYEELSILFDILLHVATLLAVLIVFRRRIGAIIVSLWRWLRRRAGDEDRMHVRLAAYIILATLITGVLGVGIEELISPGENIKLVSALFIVTALILLATTRIPKGSIDYRGIRPRHALFLGFAQGLGVFPGISRSGITISAGLFAGFRREEAGEFSFLLSIPAILGAAVLKIGDLGDLSGSIGLASLSAGMLASLLSGLGALLALMSLVRRGKLHYFAFYLIPLGLIGLIFL